MYTNNKTPVQFHYTCGELCEAIISTGQLIPCPQTFLIAGLYRAGKFKTWLWIFTFLGYKDTRKSFLY